MPAAEFEQFFRFVRVAVGMHTVEFPGPPQLRGIRDRDDSRTLDESDECARGEGAAAETEDEYLVAGAIIEDEEAIGLLDVGDEALPECPSAERLV